MNFWGHSGCSEEVDGSKMENFCLKHFLYQYSSLHLCVNCKVKFLIKNPILFGKYLHRYHQYLWAISANVSNYFGVFSQLIFSQTLYKGDLRFFVASAIHEKATYRLEYKFKGENLSDCQIDPSSDLGQRILAFAPPKLIHKCPPCKWSFWFCLDNTIWSMDVENTQKWFENEYFILDRTNSIRNRPLTFYVK